MVYQGIEQTLIGPKNQAKMIKPKGITKIKQLNNINPMLQLGAISHSKSFSITVVHMQSIPLSPSNHPGFTFQSVPDGVSDETISTRGFAAFVLDLNNSWQVALRECLVGMMGRQPQEKLSCVIYDDLMYCSGDVANQLNLPSIILRPNNATTLVSQAAVLQLIADGCLPLKDSILLDPVPGHYPLRYEDLPISPLGTVEDFLNVFTKRRRIRTSSAVIWNIVDCLEKSALTQIEEQGHVPNFTIGPLHKSAPASVSTSLLKEDGSCISWLDKQAGNSVIYVSFGSIASTSHDELVELAWGLANSKQPFLWVIRPGSVNGQKWTESLPGDLKEAVGKRGCIVKWAPQKQVLAHRAIGAFLTHCGWNSALESLAEGVRTICKPGYGDQKVITSYASQVWRAGLQLENGFERGDIERLVRRVMVEEEGEEMRERAMDLKVKIEMCTRPGGSSYNSMEELVRLIASF